jgi:hypothetical protein
MITVVVSPTGLSEKTETPSFHSNYPNIQIQ